MSRKAFLLLLIMLIQETFTLKDSKIPKGGTAESIDVGGKKLYKKRATQPEAMAYCESHGGGRLAVLLTADDAKAFVDDLYEKSEKNTNETADAAVVEGTFELGLSRRYWIGLTDLVHEGDWVWLKDGSELSYDEWWTGGQPDHYSGGTDKAEHCVVLWNPNFLNKTKENLIPKHTFNDENCEHKHYFICEDVPADANKVADDGKRPARSFGSDKKQMQGRSMIGLGRSMTSASGTENEMPDEVIDNQLNEDLKEKGKTTTKKPSKASNTVIKKQTPAKNKGKPAPSKGKIAPTTTKPGRSIRNSNVTTKVPASRPGKQNQATKVLPRNATASTTAKPVRKARNDLNKTKTSSHNVTTTTNATAKPIVQKRLAAQVTKVNV